MLFAHIAEYADGWIPIGCAGMQAALSELRRAMEKRGSDPSGLPIVPLGVLPDAAKHDAYESAGVTEAVFRLPSAPRDDVLPVLDDLSQYLRPVR